MFKKVATLSVILLAVAGCKSNVRHNANAHHTGMVTNFDSINKVYFAFNESKLENACKETLRKQAMYIKNHPHHHAITVEGHCDKRGTKDYNLALGARRAHSVKHLLVAEGIDSHKIKTVSFGKERLAALNDDEQSHALNRRAVTILTK